MLPCLDAFPTPAAATKSTKAAEAQNLTNRKQLNIINIWGLCSVESYFSFSNIKIQGPRI